MKTCLRAIGYLALLGALLLLAFLGYWIYRMVEAAGSFEEALQRAISLRWSAAAFLTLTLGGSAALALLGVRLLKRTEQE